MNTQQTAVMKTLLNALSSNLNASLTPEDCRILLDMLRPMAIESRKYPSKRKSTALDRIINSAAGVFYDSMEDLAKDIDEFRNELKTMKKEHHD
jgi:hypothetical protein